MAAEEFQTNRLGDPMRQPDVTTVAAPPGICASLAESARLGQKRRHGNAFQPASLRLRRLVSIRTERKIHATYRAMN
jgi:hypothetical protein